MMLSNLGSREVQIGSAVQLTTQCSCSACFAFSSSRLSLLGCRRAARIRSVRSRRQVLVQRHSVQRRRPASGQRGERSPRLAQVCHWVAAHHPAAVSRLLALMFFDGMRADLCSFLCAATATDWHPRPNVPIASWTQRPTCSPWQRRRRRGQQGLQRKPRQQVVLREQFSATAVARASDLRLRLLLTTVRLCLLRERDAVALLRPPPRRRHPRRWRSLAMAVTKTKRMMGMKPCHHFLRMIESVSISCWLAPK